MIRTLLFALLLLGCIAAAQDEQEGVPGSFLELLRERTTLSGTIEVESAIELDQMDIQKFDIKIEPELEIELPGDIDLTIIPLLRGDLEDSLHPHQIEQLSTSGPTRRLLIGDSVELELRELYIEAYPGDTYLKIGKQQIVWGKADGLKVLDVVNPQDFREFVLDDFDDSRTPLWSVNWEVPIKETTLQLVWIPDTTGYLVPSEGATYRFVSNLPQPPPGLLSVQRDIDRPDTPISDSDLGARLSAFVGGWDLTLNYLYHYDDVPALYRSIKPYPLGVYIQVEPQYERTHLVGTTFSNAFGDFTFRGEVGYSFDKYYSTESILDRDGVHKSDELGFVLGLDYFGISETLLSVQLFQNYLMEDAPGLLRDRVETNVSFRAQRDFMNDSLKFSTIWVHSVNHGDGFVRPKIEYQLEDNIEVWAGIDIFYGTAQGLYGQFKKTDRLVLGMEWGF